jgi:hypothetical protein
MRIITSILFLVSLAGSACAGVVPAGAPGPVIGAGFIGMTMAGGVLYLIKRRKRG